MSADNYIFIDRKTLEVWDCTASCVCQHKKHCMKCQKAVCVGKAMTLEKATKIADKHDTEYGIFFNLWCK